MSQKYTYEDLPEGFKYPKAYLEEALKGENLSPWEFISCDSEVGELLLKLASSDENNMIPFASLENGNGDAVCFDANDISDNPAVKALILDGSGRTYEYRNFAHWLELAIQDAEKWGNR
jgi:hypothetical protein